MIAHDRFDRFEVFDAFESIVPGEVGGAADDGDALLAQLIEKHRREIFRPGRAETIDDGLVQARCTHGKVTSCLFRPSGAHIRSVIPMGNGIQVLGWTPVFTGVTITFAGMTKSQ
jgi:hypothetical protein